MQCCSLWCNTFRHQFTSTLLQLYSFAKLHMERFKYFHLQYMTNFINLHLAQHFLSSSPKQRWFVMNIYRAAKRKKIHRHHRQIWSPTETVLVISETNFFICFIKKQLFSSLGDIDIKTLWVQRGGGEGDIWRNVVSPGPAMKIRSFSTLFETNNCFRLWFLALIKPRLAWSLRVSQTRNKSCHSRIAICQRLHYRR